MPRWIILATVAVSGLVLLTTALFFLTDLPRVQPGPFERGAPLERVPAPVPAVEPPVTAVRTTSGETKPPPREESPPVPVQPAVPGRPAAPGGEGIPSKEELLPCVAGYTLAPTWQGRLPYILDAERLRPTLASVYGQSFEPPPGDSRVAIAGIAERKEPLRWFEVRANISYPGKRETTLNFPVRQWQGRYLIDWEALEGYNPSSLRDFLAGRSKAVAPFRVRCRLTESPNARDKTTGDSYPVWVEEQMTGASLTAFVGKTTPEGRRLQDLLQSGKGAPLIVAMRHTDREGNFVVITDVISPSWIMPR